MADVSDSFQRIRDFQAKARNPGGLAPLNQGRFDNVRNAARARIEAEHNKAQQKRFEGFFADLRRLNQPEPVGRFGVPSKLGSFGGGRVSTSGGPQYSDARRSAAQRYVASQAAKQYGWTGAEWAALNTLINKESGWRVNAKNPTSTAWGLFQFLKSTSANYGIPHYSAAIAPMTNAGLKYIKDRYGSPSRALAFHNANNWY